MADFETLTICIFFNSNQMCTYFRKDLRPVYTILCHLHIESLFISDWGCVYTALHESDTLCSSNPVQICSASAGGTKMSPVQSVPFCFTCKHRDAIGSTPKPCFHNRMASMQIQLIDFLTNRQRKQQIC